MFGEVNLVRVLIAAIVSMIVGSLWYGPLFGKTWMKLMGINKNSINKSKKKGMWKSYLVMFIGSLINFSVLGILVSVFGATNVSGAMKVGFLVWIGFVLPLMLGSVLWEGKPVKLYFLNAAYQLVMLLIASAIMVV